ncbi:hypothetical protein ACFIOY_12885 [Bradyrhizobium sp. TZ2]
MLLAAAFGDFKEVFFQQPIGFSQNRRGYQGVFVKCQLADRLARRSI